MIERGNYERLTIPTIWIAFALSLLFHALGLFGWIPKAREQMAFQEPRLGKPSETLAIRLVPRTSPPPSAAPVPPPPPLRARPTATRKIPPPQAPAPVAEGLGRIPPIDRPSPLAVPAPAQASVAAPDADLASYIASRRRARGEAPAQAAQPAETDQQRHNRVVAENLGLTKAPTFGNDPARGDGVFTVRSMAYDSGEFAFYGWTKAINRDSLQVIEVRRGNNENMEIAMVRRMIVIIRELSSGDFLWQSRRLGKGVWLSARPRDTAELEAFMLREIFPDPRPR